MTYWMMPDTKKLLEHRYLKLVALVFHIWATVMMLMPTSGLPNIEIPYIDKLAHFGIYALFFLLWAFAFLKHLTKSKASIWGLFLALFFYGMVIELIQGRWIPDRSFDTMDMLANFIGLTIGYVAFYILKPLWPSKK